MIQLWCHNLTTGAREVIHEWQDGAPFGDAEEFAQWMTDQDKSTDHYYDLMTVSER